MTKTDTSHDINPIWYIATLLLVLILGFLCVAMTYYIRYKSAITKEETKQFAENIETNTNLNQQRESNQIHKVSNSEDTIQINYDQETKQNSIKHIGDTSIDLDIIKDELQINQNVTNEWIENKGMLPKLNNIESLPMLKPNVSNLSVGIVNIEADIVEINKMRKHQRNESSLMSVIDASHDNDIEWIENKGIRPQLNNIDSLPMLKTNVSNISVSAISGVLGHIFEVNPMKKNQRDEFSLTDNNNNHTIT